MSVTNSVGTDDMSRHGKASSLHISIENWLKVLDLEEYYVIFKVFDGVEDLLHLTEANIRDLGLSNPAHRARLASSIVAIRDRHRHIKKELICEHNAMAGYKGAPLNESPIYQTLNRVNCHSPGMVGLPEANTSVEMLQQAWYHGNISRKKAECLVVKNSDFLVRDSTTQPGSYVLTVSWSGAPLHFVINKDAISMHGQILVRFHLEGEWFSSVPALVETYRCNKRPVSEATGALLGNAVTRNVLLEYYDSRCRLMRSSPASTPTSSPLLARRRAARRAGSIDLLLDDDPRQLTPERTNVAELNVKTRCKRTGSEPLLSPAPDQIPVNFFAVDVNPGPPKPGRIPTMKRSIIGKPHVAIRNKELYEDDGRDYSDYDQVKSWPAHLASTQDVKRKNSTATKHSQESRNVVMVSPGSSSSSADPQLSYSDYDFPKASTDDYDIPRAAHESHLDMVPTKLTNSTVTLPPSTEVSSFNLEAHQSEYLTPMNKPLEASAMATMKMILMESPPELLAQHIVHLNLLLLKIIGNTAPLGLNVRCGLELITLPHGNQLRKDALERFRCLHYFISVLILICPKLVERAKMVALWIQVANELRATHGDLYGFSAVMAALNSPQIQHLKSTWEMLALNHASSLDLFRTKLNCLLADLNGAASALPLHNITIPHIVPLLTLLESPVDLESSDLTSFDLDTILGHLDVARFITEQCSLYQATSQKILKGFRPQRELTDLFCTECHLKVLWGVRGARVGATERYPKVEQLLQVLAQRAEPSGAETAL